MSAGEEGQGRLRHVALVVPDLERAVGELVAVHGLRAGPVRVNATQGVRLVHLDLGNAVLEVLSPLGPDGPLAGFLRRHPRGGLHHIALASDNIARTARTVEAAGGRLTGPPGISVDGAPIAFVHPDGAGGLLVELEGEPPCPPEG